MAATLRGSAREDFFQQVLDSTPDVVLVIADGEIQHANKAALELFQTPIESVVGSPLERFVTTPILLDSTKPSIQILQLENDEQVVAEVYYSALDDSSVVVIRDITEQSRRHEDEVIKLTNFDRLTGLPNRTLFHDIIETSFGLPDDFAVMLIDIDHFRIINNSLGNLAGDELLLQFQERIRASLPEGMVVARSGPDEFSILLNGYTNRDEAEQLTRSVIAHITREPFVILDQEVFVTASVGVGFRRDSEDAVELHRSTDIAMLRAREQGGNDFHFYTPDVHDVGASTRKILLARSLHRALFHNELYLVYQPKVEVGSLKLSGLEALLRWNSQEWGLVSPAEFIPLAEELGLILPIGEFVLKSVCEQIKLWEQSNIQHTRISVNVSARQFHSSNLVRSVRRILDETGVRGDWLEFEITETLLLNHNDQVINALREFKSMGIAISLDDFGTGHSSLNYLRRFPIDTLKIDQSFVRDLEDETNSEITAAIISMGHSLKMKVIAEGVETSSQKEFLHERRCDEMQGYLISKPLPPHEIQEMLTTS